MELRLQPKPEIEIKPADKGIVTRKEYFAKKKFEKIRQYFFPGHLIRNWKPKAELLYPSVPDERFIQYECDFNREVQSCFVEDYAEEVYLRTPPPCFVIFGKSGAHIVSLSKQIANEYGCVLIQVDDVINQVIKKRSETSKFLDKILKLGVSLTLNFILGLLSYVAHTPEARHRGYVLCGLPCFPHMYDLPLEKQFNYLFTWDNKPTVFIHVLFEDEDYVKSRSSLRYKLIKDEDDVVLNSFELELSDDEEEEEEEETDELLPIKEKVCPTWLDIDVPVLHPSIQLPRDTESQVWFDLELYNIYIKPIIDLVAARVDPQYFITVDARVKNEFEVIKARLNLLQIWKVPLAHAFHSALDEKGSLKMSKRHRVKYEANIADNIEESIKSEVEDVIMDFSDPPKTAFLKLFTLRTISPKFRWELSHYNYICPVSLRRGEIVEGKSRYAVLFMKYIYFLRDEECMKKFLQNPRPYVLPIRPKPQSRFIIAGYPYSGKTALAKYLAREFSIPLINLNLLLKQDKETKKKVYQEFCRQKAEFREMIRLTAVAWQDWRAEEEQRVILVEEWILYIQSLLLQRIEQFYSLKKKRTERVVKDVMYATSDATMREAEGEYETEDHNLAVLDDLKIHGVSIRARESETYRQEYTPPDDFPTPSERIIQALKNKDFDFHKNDLEVEANLFFSSLWSKFSHHPRIGYSTPVKQSYHNEDEEEGEGEGEEDGGFLLVEESDSDVTLDWVNLLPPQSLSSLLLQKKPHTMLERQKSFEILLTAASKAYWTPSPLKKEFAKWRLPCFMDIPLCEIFADNPLLLLKYCPEWLKERPAIPDPIDMNHPAITEAGRKAHKRAAIVNITHTKEEVGLLLKDILEKCEREGMRVSGEVISPGGWVVDDMVLDPEVWVVLAREKVYPNHIYLMIDEEPELQRILNIWNDLHPQSLKSIKNSLNTNSGKTDEETEDDTDRSSEIEGENVTPFVSKIGELLMQNLELNSEDIKELDEIYQIISNEDKKTKFYIPSFMVDSFSHDILENTIDIWKDLKEDSLNEETTLAVQSFAQSSSDFFACRQVVTSTTNLPLGAELQLVTSQIIDLFKNKSAKKHEEITLKQSTEDELKFFVSLLLLPRRLKAIKDVMNSIKRGNTVSEIIITGKTSESIHAEILKEILKPFIKKPRELENFEVDEIRKEVALENAEVTRYQFEEGYEYDDEKTGNDKDFITEREDIRIYGESGPFCIVNLERNILLKGKPEYVMRYYGKLYFFWSQEEKEKFKKNPEKYAPYYSVIRSLPPVRIFLMGPIGCRKSAIGGATAFQIGVGQVNYIQYLNRKLLPHLLPGCQKFTALGKKKLLLPNTDNEAARELRQKFMRAPYERRQYWLENISFFSDAFEEQKRVYATLKPLNYPPVPDSFPELSYLCVDTWPVEENDEASLENEEKNAPKHVFLSMKEKEQNLNNYLRDTEELTKSNMENSFGSLYNVRPYIERGFILVDFPMRWTDVKYIKENRWFPDLMIEVTLPQHDVLSRNIDGQMKEWAAKLKQEKEDEDLLEETLIAIQGTLKLVRKHELLKEKREEAIKNLEGEGIHLPYMTSQKTIDLEQKSTSKSLTQKFGEFGRSLSKYYYNLPREIDQEIEAEVDNILEEEFPPLEFNPTYESYESGKERVAADIVENYQKDVSEINQIKRELQDYNIPWFIVDGREDPKRYMNEIFRQADLLKNRTGQRGEFAFTLPLDTAEELLKQGYYFLSKFGRWCPVQVYAMKNPIHMYRPLKLRRKIIPIAYRNYIYFIGGNNEKTKFINNPVKYIFNEPHHPNIPLRIAVIGPPKSGKSILSRRLGFMFDLKVITMGSAIRFVLQKMPKTLLQTTVDNYLRRGCFLPLITKIEAIKAYLNDPQCVTQGFVLDGIPFDAAMAQSLAEEGKLPFVILSLIGDAHRGKTNREGLDVKKFRLPYKQRVNLDIKYKEWMDTYKRFSQWNLATYNNLYEMNAKLSTTDVFYSAYDIIKKSFFAILYYVEYCVTDRALPLQYLCVSQHEYELRKSAFHNNCPVCWADLSKLRSVSDPPPRSGLVQYLNNFYWICPDHMEKFLKHPKKYFPPQAPVCPSDLPKALGKNYLETSSKQVIIHGHGRCPVTRTDFPESLDWEGSRDFAVSYRGEIYFCKNKEMLDRFLARPWRYYTADTTFEYQRSVKSKAVIELGPPAITSLPPIGFLEQTVSSVIKDSLQALGIVRPIYPNLTPTCTGCIFIALYLRVHNKSKSTKDDLSRECLKFLVKTCKAYIYTINPYSRKREEGQGDAVNEPDITDSEAGSDDYYHQFSNNFEENEHRSEESIWTDLETPADKKMWSAKYLSGKTTKMRVTADNLLEEDPESPIIDVVLIYQSRIMRGNPIPPIYNCLTYIYSRKKNMQVPEKFNYNSLHQPQPSFISPCYESVMFNPDKGFSVELFRETKSGGPSTPNLWKGKQAYSDVSSAHLEFKYFENLEVNSNYMIERYIPRFQLLGAISIFQPPPVPRVVEKQPLTFTPQRDYTYTMLMSDFFQMSHVLKSYEWGESRHHLDYTSLLDKNLGLCNVPSTFFRTPKRTSSELTRLSISSYMQAFDTGNSFFVLQKTEKARKRSAMSLLNNTSLAKYMEIIILEKMDEMFTKVSDTNLSYDSYEVNILASENDISFKPVPVIREILPFPPLSWDIISRPYYAYRTIPAVFEEPRLDQIAHERHFSLLDGVIDLQNRLRFLRYPSWVHKKSSVDSTKHFCPLKPIKFCNKTSVSTSLQPRYFIYDFFNIPWTAFLPYPYALVQGLDMSNNFRQTGETQKRSSCASVAEPKLA